MDEIDSRSWRLWLENEQPEDGNPLCGCPRVPATWCQDCEDCAVCQPCPHQPAAPDLMCGALLRELSAAGPQRHITRAELATASGLAERTVARHLRHLAESGRVELRAEMTAGAGDQLRRRTRYTLPE